MEASPFDHQYYIDQCISSHNTETTSTSTTTIMSIIDELNQPHDQPYDILAPNGNNLTSPISSMSKVVDDHKVKRKMPTTNSSFNHAQSNVDMEKKTCKRWRKQKKTNDVKENKKKMIDSNEEGHIGYIHVRARRGEATDSHSLAERVRREKISEKMKTLQAIVPGCDKITGKALMLDEVINYVQYLQNEIQILSLMLASVNPMFNDYGADYEAFMLKPQQNMTTNQQQLLAYQENQMPCMLSQNNEEALWVFEEQRQGLDDLFAIINSDSFY